MKKKLIYWGSLTLKMTLIFAIIASAPQAITMEKPSWAQSLWESAKDRLYSLPLIKKELHARKQYQDLRKEVEEIVKNGKTVQEVEPKKLRDQHQKMLQDFKKCACISKKEWDYYLRTLAYAKEKNPLFVPNFKNPSKSTFKDEYYQKISDLIDIKLRERNLNPEAVKRYIINQNTLVNGSAWQSSYNYHPTENNIRINLFGLNNENLSHVINHEITHIQEHHNVQRKILRTITEKEKKHCFIPLNHTTEREAELLYALQQVTAAQHGVEYSCLISHNHIPRNGTDYNNYYPGFFWDFYPHAYHDTDTHLSMQTRCSEMKRVLNMLEIENELKEKSISRVAVKNKTKDYKYLHFVFDPAFNS